MVAKRAGRTVLVTGPRGQRIHVKFFDDGAVRFRLNEAGPMVVRYAFLPGRGHNVVLEVAPMSKSPWVQNTTGAN